MTIMLPVEGDMTRPYLRTFDHCPISALGLLRTISSRSPLSGALTTIGKNVGVLLIFLSFQLTGGAPTREKNPPKKKQEETTQNLAMNCSPKLNAVRQRLPRLILTIELEEVHERRRAAQQAQRQQEDIATTQLRHQANQLRQHGKQHRRC